MTYPTVPSAPFGPPPTPYPMNPGTDPTAVMGRRTVAWLLDFVLYFGLLFGLFTQLAVHDTFGNSCADLQDAGVTNVCVESNDDAYFLDDSSDTRVLNLFAVGWFVGVYVLLQGFTGASPGKFVLGIRVVDANGKPCGPVKSLIRSLLWIVDGAPWFIPGLVGFVVGLTSTGHRRVGDMAASTYVVGRSSVGTPITVGGPTGIPNYAPSGPQSVYGNAWAPNPAAPVSTPPMDPPAVGQPWGPAAPQATPPVGPPDAFAPPMQAEAPPPLPSRTPPPLPTADVAEPSSTSETFEPRWDAARNTYIQWDPDAAHWLAWDDTAKRWNPI